MLLPTIHLNGTSKERLIEELCEAADALREAHSKLQRCAPNGRDYYPQGREAIFEAEKEHFARLRKIVDVLEEVEKFTVAIDEIK